MSEELITIKVLLGLKMKIGKRRVPVLFLLVVLVPTFLSFYYYYYLASDQYVSEAQFIVQGSTVPRMDFFGALTGLPGSGGNASDAMVIKSYLLSNDFLQDIQASLDIRQHYSDSSIDFYARLPVDASREDLLDYWQDMARVDYDVSTSVGTIRMVAFDPKTSQQIVDIALKRSEQLINDLSNRLRMDALVQTEQEVLAAENRVNQLRQQVTQFRQAQDVLDPSAQTGSRIEREEASRSAVLSQLESQLAQAETEFAQVRSIMRPKALQYQNAQRRVEALRRQIVNERSKTVQRTTGRSAEAATQLARYEELKAEQAFAEQLYQNKQAALDQARQEHSRQQRYLTVVVKPNLPDAALLPDRFSGVLTVLLMSFLFWGIGSLSIAAIRDHVGWV